MEKGEIEKLNQWTTNELASSTHKGQHMCTINSMADRNIYTSLT